VTYWPLASGLRNTERGSMASMSEASSNCRMDCNNAVRLYRMDMPLESA